MKKVLLSLMWMAVTFTLSAQTYREYETTHGKNYLIKDKNGKYTSVQCATPKGNAKPENGFFSPVYRKEEVKPSSTINNSEDRTTYQLKLNFDVDMSPNSMAGYLFITSNSAIFQTMDLTWSEDGLTGKIDLTENTYEIIAMNNINPSLDGDPEYVIIHDFNIVSDTSTEINFAIMANHKIFLQCKDKNGEVIDPTSPTVLFNNVAMDIELPENRLMSASINPIRVPNGYIMTSDIDPEYKILLNQLFIRYGELYIADMGQIEGLTSDTVLQSNFSNYKKMDMVFHESPLSQVDKHLAFDYGTIRYDNLIGYYAVLGSSGWGFNGNYPSFDKDTLHVFMDNREIEVSDDKETAVARVYFYEGSSPMVTEPFWVNSNDSIVFTKFNVSAASPQFQNGSIVDLGNAAPFYHFCFYNDRMGENEIDYDHYRGPSVGQINEMRQMDNNFSIYEIKIGTKVIANDTLSNFTTPLYAPEQGIYTFNITNENYKLKEQPGKCIFEASFDMGSFDANPPVISSFKLLNSENSITNSFQFDQTGTILLSAFDYSSSSTLDPPASVQIFYKKYNDNDWTELNVVEYPDLYDPVDFGNIYKSDLGAAFAQFTASGYLDLKITASDMTGNSMAQILHPAAFVENTVGIPRLCTNEKNSLQVYPNPVTENSMVSFTLSESSNVKLSVYNLNGQLINTLLDKPMIRGNHQLSWPTTDRSGKKPDSGIYLLKLETRNTVETSKVVVH
ncbi:MAG: T9SS type A sorting domain-containing protein [Bacteroidales bacterium]|nr:T9SS type A sorting domain-containing protein [Bacteroidales bacterium]